jgi:hypothetical protein
LKRDMDLVRTILLETERQGDNYLADIDLSIEGKSPGDVGYHVVIMHEAGLIEADIRSYLGGEDDIVVHRLTWAGHEFLDTIRDEEIWRKTKQGAKDAGGFTLDLLREIAKGLIKKQVEKYTGVHI